MIEEEREFHIRRAKAQLKLKASPWDWIKSLIDPLLKSSLPVFDGDRDKFSSSAQNNPRFLIFY